MESQIEESKGNLKKTIQDCNESVAAIEERDTTLEMLRKGLKCKDEEL